MKFRGKMIEPLMIRKFYAVLGTMARISKVCVLRLTADKMFFVLVDRGPGGGPAVWAEINQEDYFNEYNIEGVSQEQNEIFLELSPEKLSKTLGGLRTSNARSLKMKLTKKSSVPCLTFEVELPGLQGCRSCIHDIPVTVLGRTVWKDYQEPPMPPFDVSVCLPDIKKLRHLIDRYKMLGQAVTLTASRQGSLSLRVESDEGDFSTHYPNLKVPVYRDDSLPWRRLQSQDPGHSASVRVDLKRLVAFLQPGDSTSQPKRAIANIVQGDLLHMFLVHEDLLVQYFIPATSKL